MRIPRHWAKAEHRWPDGGLLRVWRGSDAGAADAAAAAGARLRELLAEIAAGRAPKKSDYADRPVREEILSELPGPGGPAALVTRNAQGAEVLNTARVLFIDLDFARFRRAGAASFLSSLFGRKPPADPESRAREALERWLAREPRARVRLYRTRAGLRALRLDRLHEPAADGTAALFAAVGADPLYARLCRVQNSFRARLTPKYHRLGMARIPGEWPCDDADAARARTAWLADYARRSRERAVCAFLAEYGDAPIDAEAGAVLDLHDRRTLGAEGAALA